jgi:phosphomannomutase
MDADPDPATRAETQALLDAHDEQGLADRFGTSLSFGTAGLRARLGAGPNRMNRLTVRRAAGGLARYLSARVPDAAERGVVIGYDARHGSAEFAHDTAAVLAAAGLRARLLPARLPTPVLAWSITEVGAAAGVMVTASHNPAHDNGYKVYLGQGAQIVTPQDLEIAACIDAVGFDVALARGDHHLIDHLGPEVVEAYLDQVAAVRLAPRVPGARVVCTALHGVGGAVAAAAFRRAGFDAPEVVAAQQEPDADFPTVALPNPEEPGTMDAVIELAAARAADVALAHDPDADRLGVAIPTATGDWRRLSGDEVGWLLADHILSRTSGADRLVVTTLVSSSMLSRLAAAYGVHHLETYTGFKWIARAILDHPQWRFVFGYEQALGYLVAPRPLDKDGISAAVMMAEVAGCARADGVTLEQRLAGLERRFGHLVTAERAVAMSAVQARRVMSTLSSSPPATLAGQVVDSVETFAAASLVRLWCNGVRLQVRPSGTEAKIKLYAETDGTDATAPLEALAAWLGSPAAGRAEPERT